MSLSFSLLSLCIATIAVGSGIYESNAAENPIWAQSLLPSVGRMIVIAQNEPKVVGKESSSTREVVVINSRANPDAKNAAEIQSLLWKQLAQLTLASESPELAVEDNLRGLSTILEEPKQKAYEDLAEFERWIKEDYRPNAPDFETESIITLTKLEHKFKSISERHDSKIRQLANTVHALTLQEIAKQLAISSSPPSQPSASNKNSNNSNATSPNSGGAGGGDCPCEKQISDPPPIRVNRTVPDIADLNREGAKQARWAAAEARKCGCTELALIYEQKAKEMEMEAENYTSR